MRLLIGIVAVLGLLWSGYWLIGAMAMERGLSEWIDDRRDDGWQADYAELDTRGFPNRFDTTFSDLTLADPDTGVAWTAPFFQILSLSYRPNHVIAIWPDTQMLATPQEKIALSTSDMRGSLRFTPNTSLALQQAQIQLADVKAVSDQGWTSELSSGTLAVRETPDTDLTYDIAFEAIDLAPAGGILALMTSGSTLPDTIAQLKLDVTAAFDAPWDRRAIEVARPQPTKINVKLIKATWGDLDLQLTGEMDVDAEGYPTGQVSVQARNWRDMLALAVRLDALPEELLSTAESAFGLLAGFSGNPNTLDATLTFRDRFMAFGPIPIGRAPRLVLR